MTGVLGCRSQGGDGGAGMQESGRLWGRRAAGIRNKPEKTELDGDKKGSISI